MRFLNTLLFLTAFTVMGCATTPPINDADGDGVQDSLDKCVDTPANTNIDADGCPLKTSTDASGVVDIILNVHFETGSAKIDPQFTEDLKKFGEFMVKYPKTYAQIEGHTDNTGTEKFNYRISQKRAESVRRWLLSHYKIGKKRLTSKGYGPSQPVADNSTPEGRLKNRRVVAHVQTEATAK